MFKLLRMVLVGLLWSLISLSPAIAAPNTAIAPWFAVQSPPGPPPALTRELDDFLSSIPRGYYTFRTVESLQAALNQTQPPLLVDVRTPGEYRAGHLPAAINIPLRELGHNLDRIPRDRPVVVYCSTGYRSAMGVMTLHLLGYDQVQGFPPGFAGWEAAGGAIAP